MHTNISYRRLSYPSRTTSKSGSRSSSKRRNESLRSRSYLATSKSHSSLRDRNVQQSDREHLKHQKKSKRSSESRSKIVSPRKLSSEQSCTYSKSKEPINRKRDSPRVDSTNLRDEEGERFQADDEYVVNKPLFRGSEKDILNDRDSLKKIVINMREVPSEANTIKRQIINPEDITIVRRAGEGSRPIFERDEIINHRRRLEEEEERNRRRNLALTERSDFRPREIHYKEERNQKSRSHRRSRSSPSYYDSWAYDKFLEKRRSKSRNYERKSSRRYHRSPESVEERYLRRQLKSPECRRHNEYRNTDDSTEKPQDWKETENDFSDVEYVSVNQRYETEDAEFATATSPEEFLTNPGGRRTIIDRTFAAPAEVIMCPVPRVRPIRATFIPRAAALPVVRFPFPPRMIRPMLRPIAPVIAPIIRHPYIPLPY